MRSYIFPLCAVLSIRNLPLNLLIHLVVELLLPDEHGDGGEDSEQAEHALERPEVSLLYPTDLFAAER